MTARVRSGLVEGPQAVALPPSPHSNGHLPEGRREMKPADGCARRSLRRKRPPLSRRPTGSSTGSSRARSARSSGGRPRPARARTAPWPKSRRSFEPIWKSPRYWPFCAVGRKARLAPGDVDRLPAVRPEHAADRDSRRRARRGVAFSAARRASRISRSVVGDLPCCACEAAPRAPSARGAIARCSPSSASERCDSRRNGSCFGACAPRRSFCASRASSERSPGALSLALACVDGARCSSSTVRCRGRLGDEREAHRPTNEGFQSVDLLIGRQGRGSPTGAARVTR